MKSKLLALNCLIFMMANGLFAQSYIGFLASLNSGKFSGDTPRNFKYASKVNFSFGFGYDLQIKEDIYLSFLSEYVNGSSKLLHPKTVDDEEVYEDSIKLNFQLIALPVLMKLISDNKRFQFTSGFELLYPIKLEADDSSEKTDLKNDINKLNLSMLFGIGYIIPVDKSKLVINITYSQGLTNLANNLNDPESLLPRIRYTSFRFTLGWYLPVGKNRFSQTPLNE